MRSWSRSPSSKHSLGHKSLSSRPINNKKEQKDQRVESEIHATTLGNLSTSRKKGEEKSLT